MAETAWFTYDDFAPRVGEQFIVALPDEQSLPLVLAEATPGLAPEGAERRQFSLLFRGPADRQLGQGIWELQHDELDGLALFLVPLGPDAEGPRYEAVFG